MLQSVERVKSQLNPFRRLFFYCVDPGAFSVMFPVFEALKYECREIIWILDGWCKVTKGKELPAIDWDAFKHKRWTEPQSESCFFLGTQTSFQQSQKVIRYCKQSGLFSLFIFDHWVNYIEPFWDSSRSELYLPDRICIMDELAREALVARLLPLLDDKKYINNIEIVGHPAIEKSIKVIESLSEAQIKLIKKRVNPEGKELVLFLPEPIENDFGYNTEGKLTLGYSEYTILNYFFKNYPLDKVKVLIKPHPRQSTVELQKFLTKHFMLTIIDCQLIMNENLESLIAVADEVVGITTVALIVALKAGKKIKSFQVGRNKLGCLQSNYFLEKYLVI